VEHVAQVLSLDIHYLFRRRVSRSITAKIVGGISIYAGIIISPIIAIIYFSYRTYVKNLRASAELRESEERYRELFENAKDATYVHDLSGRYTSVNRAAEKLTGYTRAEILGKALFSLFLQNR